MSTDKPSSTSDSDFVNEAYNLEDAESMAAFYRKWAADYDRQMLDDLGYVSPMRIAEILARYLGDTGSPVLDVGCGTGLTCRLLHDRGYDHLHGIDLSSDMLAVAGERGIYRQLTQADLNEPLPLADNQYSAVISSGTFTHGHVGPEPLRELFRVLVPGGFLACTVHQDLWQSMGFESTFEALVSEGVAVELENQLGPYFEGKPAEGWFCVYQKRQD